MQPIDPKAYAQEIDDVLKKALQEDVHSGDITAHATIPSGTSFAYQFTAREEAVFCGADVLKKAAEMHAKTLAISLKKADGAFLEYSEIIADIHGNAHVILETERTLLNLIQRLSGIATLTKKYVDAVADTGVLILDTRKTFPGLRHLEKHAVSCGGGINHRIGLYDMILIKDNHIAAVGNVKKAVEAAKAFIEQNHEELSAIELVPHPTREQLRLSPFHVTIECDTEAQVAEAVDAGADRILLDNMTPERLNHVVNSYSHLGDSRPIFEASGGVTLQTVREIALSGVDCISIGALTHSAPNIDIGLDSA